MGIGGGFLMTIYSKQSGKIETLNARETAPGDATIDMYHGDAKASEKGKLLYFWRKMVSNNIDIMDE